MRVEDEDTRKRASTRLTTSTRLVTSTKLAEEDIRKRASTRVEEDKQKSPRVDDEERDRKRNLKTLEEEDTKTRAAARAEEDDPRKRAYTKADEEDPRKRPSTKLDEEDLRKRTSARVEEKKSPRVDEERDKKKNTRNEEDKKQSSVIIKDDLTNGDKKKSKENVFEDDKMSKDKKNGEHDENGHKNGKRNHSQDKEEKIKPKRESGTFSKVLASTKKDGSKEEIKVTPHKGIRKSTGSLNINVSCYHCRRSISGKGLIALGKKWHAECFVCTDCEKPLGTTFCNYNDIPFCEDCYSKSFLQKCIHCNSHFGPGEVFIKALGGMWHRTCFNCNKCGKGFPDGLFSEKNGKPYCAKCS